MKTRVFLLTAVAAAIPALAAAQAASSAQARYDSEIRACNGGNMARTERDECVRRAGFAFDEAKRAAGAGLPANRVSTPNAPVGQSYDGRAALVPQSEQRPMVDQGSLSQPGLATTRDGRATVVPQQ